MLPVCIHIPTGHDQRTTDIHLSLDATGTDRRVRVRCTTLDQLQRVWSIPAELAVLLSLLLNHWTETDILPGHGMPTCALKYEQRDQQGLLTMLVAPLPYGQVLLDTLGEGRLVLSIDQTHRLKRAVHTATRTYLQDLACFA